MNLIIMQIHIHRQYHNIYENITVNNYRINKESLN